MPISTFAKQDIQLMIAENALGGPALDERPHFINDCGTVRAAIDQVPEEHEPTPLRVLAFTVVSEVA